jgi:hypothetical protein
LLERSRPNTVKELQAWLGIVNYYRNYVEHYAELAQSLYQLTGYKDLPKSFRKKIDGKKVTVIWTDEANENFEKIKTILCSDLVLALPDYVFRNRCL